MGPWDRDNGPNFGAFVSVLETDDLICYSGRDLWQRLCIWKANRCIVEVFRSQRARRRISITSHNCGHVQYVWEVYQNGDS